MSGQIFVNPTNLPSWAKEMENKITGHQFDSMIKTSGKVITEAIFRKEFLPLFTATNEIPPEAYESFIKRWIFYAHQPYNSLDVYRTLDGNGEGVDLLFTVPPLWNGKAPILKAGAMQPPKDSDGQSYEKDPTIFRTLLARINQYVVAQDQLQLMKHRDHLLPLMVEESAAIELEDLVNWKKIFAYYGFENETTKSLDRLTTGQGEDSGSNDQPEATGATVMAGADEL